MEEQKKEVRGEAFPKASGASRAAGRQGLEVRGFSGRTLGKKGLACVSGGLRVTPASVTTLLHTRTGATHQCITASKADFSCLLISEQGVEQGPALDAAEDRGHASAVNSGQGADMTHIMTDRDKAQRAAESRSGSPEPGQCGNRGGGWPGGCSAALSLQHEETMDGLVYAIHMHTCARTHICMLTHMHTACSHMCVGPLPQVGIFIKPGSCTAEPQSVSRSDGT